MADEPSGISLAARKLQSLYSIQRSIESQRRPWILWSISAIIALSMLGYPIAGSMAQIFSVESTVFSYPFRGLIAGLSVALIVSGIVMGHFRLPLLIGLFLVAYLIRMAWDYNFSLLPNAGRDMLFYISSVLLPTLAMCTAHLYYEERNASLMFLPVGVVACVFIIYAIYLNSSLTSELSLTQRNYFEALNPITISYTGMLTAVAAFTAFQFLPTGQRWLIVIPAVAIGLTAFLLGGSRGPVIGASLFFGLYAIVRQKAFLGFSILAGLVVIILLASTTDIAVFQRFMDIQNDISVLQRLDYQMLSWQAAVENPLFGSAYLELTTLTYPHNLVIESAMALGFFGAALMLVLQITLFRDLLTLMRAELILLPMIGTTALANAWISGSLPASRDFYMCVVLCWLIAKRIRWQEDQEKGREMLARVVRNSSYS